MSWLSRRGKASGPASDGTRPQPAPRPPAAPSAGNESPPRRERPDRVVR